VEVNIFERVSLQQMIKNALPDLENRLISSQLDLF
jgi:ABC-type arginine transport system permease subunit